MRSVRAEDMTLPVGTDTVSWPSMTDAGVSKAPGRKPSIRSTAGLVGSGPRHVGGAGDGTMELFGVGGISCELTRKVVIAALDATKGQCEFAAYRSVCLHESCVVAGAEGTNLVKSLEFDGYICRLRAGPTAAALSSRI